MQTTSPNPSQIVFFCIAVAVGAAIGWLLRELTARRSADESVTKDEHDRIVSELSSTREGNQRLLVDNARLEATIQAERTAAARERESVTDYRERIADVFRSVGADVLRDAMEQADARSALAIETSHRHFEAVLEPVADATQRLGQSLQDIEVARHGSYERLTTTVEALGRTERDLAGKISDLGSTTSGLAQALRNPSARGNWGEYHLRRVVELAGMVEHCDFAEQETILSGEGGSRPDLTVMITDTHRLFVDAKAPLSAYLEAAEATDDRVRSEALKRHVSALRLHVKTLGGRGYARKDARSGEMVVMYVPSEGALSAAIAQDRDVIEDALAAGVVLAGPMQLVALLRMFAYGWRQQQFERNAGRVIVLAREFVERANVFGGHMADLQRSIVSVVRTYNAAAGSAESRMLVTARRITALGGGTEDTAQTELRFVEDAPRLLAAPELTGSET